jgi:hypothetical protein
VGVRAAITAIVLVLTCVQSAAADAPQAACLKALVPLAADAIPASGNFAPADCLRGNAGSPFHYDRASGVTRLARSVAPGEIVPRYPDYGIAMVQPGQKLTLVVALGAVRIEREVVAMQPARLGQRLFVRSADGEIMSARYGEDAQ